MGWLEALEGQIVGLDTAPLIYFIEEHPSYLPLVEPFFTSMDNGQISVVTSTITLLEVLVYPISQNNIEAIDRYRDVLLHAEHLTTVDVSPAIAVTAASLRARYKNFTPDAVQLATAIEMGASAFLTNDKTLRKVSELEIIVVADL